MEFTRSIQDSPGNFKNSHELSTMLQSPYNMNDRSTNDLSHFSNSNTSLQISPIPKHRKTPDSTFSPNISTFTLSDKKKVPKSHLLLEEQLIKIEQEHSIRSRDELNERFQTPKPGVLIEEHEERLDDYSRGNRQIPTLLWCAHCKGEMTTKVVYVNTSKTFWSSVGILFSGGVLGCFMLPYMTNCCKGVQLVCQKCGRVLG